MKDLADRISKARLAGASDSKIVEIVREHDKEKWRLHSEGVKLIKAHERQRCIDVGNECDYMSSSRRVNDSKQAYDAAIADYQDRLKALENQE